ncbi:MAG: CehA/McbA family metallohydrolase [Bryobacteraceae bacterium]
MKRRSFLQGIGAGAPALELVATAAAPAGPEKFTPVPLDKYFNASAREFGPRAAARSLNPPAGDDLIHAPAGEQQFQGVPFRLGPADVDRKSWVVLSTRSHPWASRSVEVPIGRTAGFLCLAQFCDWDPAESESEDADTIEKIGDRLADAVLLYEDGEERAAPVRRRFEVNPPANMFGRDCFNALASASWRAVSPLGQGAGWGRLQTAVQLTGGRAVLWIWALENPAPGRRIRSLRLQSANDDYLVLCGLTLYHGRENPLRKERRQLYRFTLPSATAAESGRWQVEADLGTVCRTFPDPAFQPEVWLKSESAGLGERGRAREGLIYLYAEVTASAEATLTLRDTVSGARYEFDLARLEPGRALQARQGGSRVEVLEREKAWLHGKVIDDSTGRPAPARIAFRSAEGRYIPPYGHRTEINPNWFEDYGADVQVGTSPFAYIDGTFQVELPAGDVYVELSKGFEYQAVRQRVRIAPGQRELELRIPRLANWRKSGWITADTHVHFLSPSTAVLEAQAEGLNLVNLLAAQWGDLFTNVGDLPYGHLFSPDRETMVAVGTENRQHLMGHLGLLGGHGEPVFPMSADGPSEGYLGDPLWTSMSDWADACRRRDGVVVAVHFPNPNAEMAAEIVRGKVDAVELYPRGDAAFRSLAYCDWYRYLNCGYRVAAAGGTDKMAASTPVGGNRTYAFLAGQEFTFANWAAAVRAGRTFATTGPLIDFRADGRMAGDEIRLRAGGGRVEVAAEATSYVPFHRLEVVLNGKVVASREEAGGARQMKLSEAVSVKAPGWLAVRCSSRVAAARFAVAAHTSPVYLATPGQEVFSSSAAAYFLKLIEGTQIYVDHLAIRPDRARLERIAGVLKEAHTLLHSRMRKQGG